MMKVIFPSGDLGLGDLDFAGPVGLMRNFADSITDACDEAEFCQNEAVGVTLTVQEEDTVGHRRTRDLEWVASVANWREVARTITTACNSTEEVQIGPNHPLQILGWTRD